jgi:ribonuclease J
VNVIQPQDCAQPIHASGHPGQADLAKLYQWIKPDVLIPVHGEDEHLDAHVKLAKSQGITRQLNGRNGDLFVLAPNKALRRGVVDASRLGVGRKALEQIT